MYIYLGLSITKFLKLYTRIIRKKLTRLKFEPMITSLRKLTVLISYEKKNKWLSTDICERKYFVTFTYINLDYIFYINNN